MSEVEQPQETQQPQQEQQEELSEIQQLARQGKFKDAGGSAVFCVKCEKKSYPAETVFFEKIPYHKQCFSCTRCNKKIEGGFNAAQFEYKLYCRSCFQQAGFNRQQAQVKWTPKASGSATPVNPQFANLGGGGQTCKVCAKTVYTAEATLFEKNHYHADCLRCQEDGCGTLCTVANLNQFDGKLYCNPCWTRGNYNKKQLAITQGAPAASGSYNPIAAKLGGGGTACTTCGGTVYPAEMVTFEKKPYHSACLKCSECALKMTLAQANQFEDRIFCTSCWNQGGYVKKQRDAAKAWTPKESTDAAAYNPVAAKLGGGGLKCKTCEKTVYPAEAILYETNHYHPLCFKCTHCNARIENINQAQHNKQRPFHQRCFQELGLHRPENA